jgi:O-methyltransferase
VLDSLLRRFSRAPQTLVPEPYVRLLLRHASEVVGRVPGDIMEIGVYRGGTLYRLARHLEARHRAEMKGRALIGIDTFEGHPYISEKDPAHHFKGRFADTSYEAVAHAMRRFEFVRLLKGECGEVCAGMPETQRFCLLNLDVDIYDSYVRAISYAFPRLSPGGVLICDEYQGYGHKAFIDEYFRDKPVRIEPRTGLAKDYGLVITRTG